MTRGPSKCWLLGCFCITEHNWQLMSLSDVPSRAEGTRTTQAASTNGAVLTRAREDKERKCAELLESERCRLVVVALEMGGRWSTEATEFMDSLAARAREAPRILWRSAFLDGGADGAGCLPSRVPGPSLLRWWLCQPPPSPGLTAPHPTWPTSSRCEAAVFVFRAMCD